MSEEPPRRTEPRWRQPRRSARADFRVAVAVAGPVLFTPPVLALANREGAIFGIPPLLIFVFLAWLAGIVLTAFAARDGGQ